MTTVLLSSQNVGGGTAVVQVRATDRDTGINSVLSYYITEGNEDMTFRMDRISGEIATRPAPPDRERQGFYHLVVTVEDEGTPPLSVSRAHCAGWGAPSSCLWPARAVLMQGGRVPSVGRVSPESAVALSRRPS